MTWRKEAAELDARARRDRRFVPELQKLLDELSVVIADVRFRYIPTATVVLGSDVGDFDERPAREVHVDDFWMAERPILFGDAVFGVHSLQARRDFFSMNGFSSREAQRYSRYDNATHPFISIPHYGAVDLARRLATHDVYGGKLVGRLPTEDEWERAARGCFCEAEYPWGDERPDESLADYGRFGDWSLRSPYEWAPNDYGLHSMAGCVWEWCSNAYVVPAANLNEATPRQVFAVRGGSYTDDDIAMRCAFRMAISASHFGPNIGMRPILVPASRVPS